MVGFNLDIPEEVHKEFKKKCVDLGMPMEDIVLELITRYVKKKRGE